MAWFTCWSFGEYSVIVLYTCIRQQSHLRLRGLCAYSDIDTIYTPKNYGKDGELMFVGYDHNQIIYDYATSQWEITKLSVTGNFTRAVTKASLASMAIGTNVWTVFNDSKRWEVEKIGVWRFWSFLTRPYCWGVQATSNSKWLFVAWTLDSTAENTLLKSQNHSSHWSSGVRVTTSTKWRQPSLVAAMNSSHAGRMISSWSSNVHV